MLEYWNDGAFILPPFAFEPPPFCICLLPPTSNLYPYPFIFGFEPPTSDLEPLTFF